MTDVTDLTEQVLRTWDRQRLLIGVTLTPEVRQQLANAAVSVLTRCPETHPDRPDVRCNQDNHDNGHLYHRNSDLCVEWWASGDGVTNTIHDVLGPIQLTPALVPVREWGGANVDTRDDPPGRYHTLPPCDDATAATTDTIATVRRADNHDRFWSLYPNTPPPTPTDPGTDANDDVYRDLIPILETVAGFLDRMGWRYRTDNPRMTSEMCRTAETHRDELDQAAGSLRDLIDGTGGG